ncbi:hydroxymethylglutaryl-CoA synthase family protein [Rhodobium gokarnense]|uniref:3-hydroxy-3-methylglutaryl CoA synthase n=1 Tax=Rhodobium gokarnense TaxID=364296 RepID=A0ABT3H7I3_9HYPH|nr:3-oxoacyl-[acyl-carrier-protein] synthase III C-terminal domain-containing protein [Rhodobium gokarnense]MCW2306348.1 3-hydroxy-3-methylglutaryl CoA synthase [Rhodobium gokarnense]
MQPIGITSIGVHIPYYYMQRNTIAAAWGARGLKGCRSVANVDEDAVTMAVEAIRDAGADTLGGGIQALYFASTTAPYAEKSHAAIVARACSLPETVFTMDLASSLKAGTGALRMALDAAIARPGTNTVVVAADCRDAAPKSPQEQLFGDAAAAVTIGDESPIAVIDHMSGNTREIVDVWRNAGERHINTAEPRFVTDCGYKSAMQAAISSFLEETHSSAADYARLVISTSDLREHLAVSKKLGFSPEQVQDPLMLEIGCSGTAQVFVALAAALETASPGDRILVANYGNGADVFSLTVTDAICRCPRRSRMRDLLASRRELAEYGRLLSFRGTIEPAAGEPFRLTISTAMTWRDQGTYLGLEGSVCEECGTAAFPVNRVCHSCGAKDKFTVSPRSRMEPEIFTYSIDRLAGRSDDPVVVQTVAQDESGCRYYLNMTDFNPEEIFVGKKLNFTLRKIHNLGNFVNYYWKFRPLRKAEEKNNEG